MTEEQAARVSKLKMAIAVTTRADGAPHDVRAAVAELKKELKLVGTTARSLALALGVHVTTLCRWEREVVMASSRRGAARGDGATRGAGFRRVEVVESAVKAPRLAAAPVPVVARQGLRVVHGPSGLIIDGLDVEALAALLRGMS